MASVLEINQNYLSSFNGASNEDLVKAFAALTISRKRGGDRTENLQPYFNVLFMLAEERGLNLYSGISKPEKELEPEIPELELTPESSAIFGYAYNEAHKTLYIRFQSNETVYTFPDVPKVNYDKLCAAESKGRFVGKNIKSKFLRVD